MVCQISPNLPVNGINYKDHDITKTDSENSARARIPAAHLYSHMKVGGTPGALSSGGNLAGTFGETWLGKNNFEIFHISNGSPALQFVGHQTVLQGYSATCATFRRSSNTILHGYFSI